MRTLNDRTRPPVTRGAWITAAALVATATLSPAGLPDRPSPTVADVVLAGPCDRTASARCGDAPPPGQKPTPTNPSQKKPANPHQKKPANPPQKKSSPQKKPAR